MSDKEPLTCMILFDLLEICPKQLHTFYPFTIGNCFSSICMGSECINDQVSSLGNANESEFDTPFCAWSFFKRRSMTKKACELFLKTLRI
jgi:hypothetical protein